jgi:hypothetical protein
MARFFYHGSCAVELEVMSYALPFQCVGGSWSMGCVSVSFCWKKNCLVPRREKPIKCLVLSRIH